MPIFFVLALGYIAGRAKQFNSEQARGLNELVLEYALPAALFVGTTKVSRTQLLQQGGFFLALLISFLVLYLIAWLVGRYVFHRTSAEAAVLGWMSSAPTSPFIGTPILGGIFGTSSTISISLSAIILNVIQVPLTVAIIEVGRSQASKEHPSLGKTIQSSVLEAIKEPVVFVPILAFLLVLTGIQVPSVIDQMLSLIGTASSGVAIFFSGLTLAAYKLKLTKDVIVGSLLKVVGQPLLMAAIALGLGITNPGAREGILICALSSSVVGVILASRYKIYESEAAAILLLTSMMMIVILPAAIALTAS